MKKIIVFFFIILFICGCGKEITKTENNEKKENKKEEVVTPTYQDNNNTPISFYKLNGNTLTKVNEITGNFNPMDDIFLLQIYPSNLDSVNLNGNFGSSFYEEYSKYNGIKIGFNITYKVNGEEISYNILTPSNTMDHWEQFMAYIYDDYINRGKGFYSHIENDEYTDSTLFTSLKLQCGAYCKDASDIKVTVFTYDSEDDFLDNNYRGNSSSTISICLTDNC